MSDTRIVSCGHCDGEGRLYHGFVDDGWSEECPACRGTRSEEIETLPAELEDLEELWRSAETGAQFAEICRLEALLVPAP